MKEGLHTTQNEGPTKLPLETVKQAAELLVQHFPQGDQNLLTLLNPFLRTGDPSTQAVILIYNAIGNDLGLDFLMVSQNSKCILLNYLDLIGLSEARKRIEDMLAK